MTHSEYKPDGSRKQTSDGYWAACDARDERARFQEWDEKPPLPKPPPLPEQPMTKEAQRFAYLSNKILHAHISVTNPLTKEEQIEYWNLLDTYY